MYVFPHWAISGHSFKTISLQGEGVAYRGRILVELSTKLDQKADKAVDGIHTDDILVVQVSAWFVWVSTLQVRAVYQLPLPRFIYLFIYFWFKTDRTPKIDTHHFITGAVWK